MTQSIPDESVGVLKHTSPWMLAVRRQFQNLHPDVLIDWEAENIRFIVFQKDDSLWIQAVYPGGGSAAFRAAYCPGVELELDNPEECPQGVIFHINAPIGKMRVEIQLPLAGRALVRWTTSLIPDFNLSIPFWPRDLYLLDEKNRPLEVEGMIHASQHGLANATQFLSLTKPRSGMLLYFQNLTALNQYAEKTCASLEGCLGGAWPELGLSLPGSSDHPLPAGEEVILSDGFAVLSSSLLETEAQRARLYLDWIAEIYLLLPRPSTDFHPWPDRSDACYHSIRLSPKCFTTIDGNRYLAPYVGALEKPPESMVQLAVLVPLVEFADWKKVKLDLIDDLRASIKNFYDPSRKILLRFLPGADFPPGKREEQEDHQVMDSWYLYHPLVNLGRLAQKGFDDMRELFFNALEFGIQVAHHFQYNWPVFYNLDTLEIIKAETAPGAGGETDVGCIYILLMMQAYELSQDQRYVEEAERAASAIAGKGFRLLYETNITSFGISGLLRLYEVTHNTLYRDLCYVCLANIIQNTWFWECNFGYAKNYKTIMGALPLRDAPYLASYEELEILAAFHDFVVRSGPDTPRSAILLMGEYIRYGLDTTWYDFPVELPEEMISTQVKTGEIDRTLTIPLEDLYEGWQQAGQVGQDVYGTSSAFVYTSRFFVHETELPFFVFCEFPTRPIVMEPEHHRLCLPLLGDERIQGDLRIIPRDPAGVRLHQVIVSAGKNGSQINGQLTDEGHLRFPVQGGQEVWIAWQDPQKS